MGIFIQKFRFSKIIEIAKILNFNSNSPVKIKVFQIHTVAAFVDEEKFVASELADLPSRMDSFEN